MTEKLNQHLDNLARDDCYRVDQVLKDGPLEVTELVHFEGGNGALLGPFVRKRIDRDAGIGGAYWRLFEAQRDGRRFLYLPRIIDVHEAGSNLIIVMEHIRGETLADVVFRCDPSVALARDVFPRLCDAVGELHDGFSPPIIHRDLKPSNIMLSHNSLTIIDFGIARVFDAAADEDTRHFGTRGYAPPEQFGYGQTSVRSDVYALGLLLFFCLTENMPDGKARACGYASKLIPEPLRQVISHAAAFDPEARYENVATLKQQFIAAAESANVSAPTALETSSPLPGPASHPTLTAAVEPARNATSTLAPTSASVRPDFDSQSLASQKKRSWSHDFWAHIPRGVGLVWDALIALTFVLFMAVSTQLAFFPEAGSAPASIPLPNRITEYYSVSALVVGPILYLLADRRPLRQYFSAFRTCTVRREVLICLACEVAGFFAIGIASTLLPSA